MAIGRLSSLGTFEYNGVHATEVFRTKMTGRMKYDEAGRTVVGTTYTLEVEFHLQEPAVGVSTDDTMDEIWRYLSKPGGKLLLSDRGTGTFNVNDGTVWDSDWGPKPRILSWRSAGAEKAAFVTWSCETTIPRCEDPRYKGVSALNFEVQDSIDESGWTTRTISGYLEIAQTRKAVGQREVPETADEYRNHVMPIVPEGFRIQSQQWRTSKSKNRLDFTITLKEVPYPLPPGLAAADIDDSIESSMSSGFVNWTRTISGTVRLSPGMPKRLAWRKCLLIILSGLRTQALPKADKQAPPAIPLGKEHTTLLWSLKVTNQKFGDRISFAAVIRVIGPNLVEMLNGSGILDPMPGTDFRKWKTSLQGGGKPWDARGVAGLQVDAREDVIIDLCGNVDSVALRPGAESDRPQGEKFLPGQDDPQPDANGAWLLFQASATVDSSWKATVVKVLQPIVNPANVFGAALDALDKLTFGVGGKFVKGPAGDVVNVLARIGNPDVKVVVTVRALRIGKPIEVPRVEKIGDVEVGEGEGKALLTLSRVKPSTLGKVGGLVIYGLTVRQEYTLPREPGGDQLFPANPVIRFEQKENP